MADQGEEQHDDWATQSVSDPHDESPPSSPLFAPVGRPMVRKRFRSKIPDPLRIDVPRMNRLSSLSSLHNSYSVSSIFCGHASHHRQLTATMTEGCSFENRSCRCPQVHRTISIYHCRIPAPERPFYCWPEQLLQPVQRHHGRDARHDNSNIEGSIGNSSRCIGGGVDSTMGIGGRLCALDEKTRGPRSLCADGGCVGRTFLYSAAMAKISAEPSLGRNQDVRCQVTRV